MNATLVTEFNQTCHMAIWQNRAEACQALFPLRCISGCFWAFFLLFFLQFREKSITGISEKTYSSSFSLLTFSPISLNFYISTSRTSIFLWRFPLPLTQSHIMQANGLFLKNSCEKDGMVVKRIISYLLLYLLKIYLKINVIFYRFCTAK